MTRGTIERWTPAAAGLAAFALASLDLGAASLTTDEGFTRQALERPPDGLLALLADQELNSGLHLVLLRAWASIAGTSELALRLPSVVLFAASTGLLVRVSKRLGLPGPFAAMLFMLSGFVLQHAREARNYALGTLAAVVLMDRFLAWVDSPDGRHDVQYGLALAFAVYAHFFVAAVVAAQWIALALHPEHRHLTTRLVRPTLLAAVLASPIAAFLLAGGNHGQLSWVPRLDLTLVGSVASHLAGHGPFVASGAVLAVLAAVAVGWLRSGLGCSGHPSAWNRTLVLAWLAFPSLLLAATSLAEPVLHPRFVLFSAPAVALVLAGALAGATRFRALLVIGLVVLLVPGSVRELARGSREDWRAATELVADRVMVGDRLVFAPIEGRWGFDAYLRDPTGFPGAPAEPPDPFGDLVSRGARSEGTTTEIIARLTEAPGRVWLIERLDDDEVGAEVAEPTLLDRRLDGVRVRLLAGTVLP